MLVVVALLIMVSATSAAAADEATIQLYKTKCQACHMADGNSPIPEMNFAGGSWIHGRRLADVVKVIEEGVPGKAMVSFKEQLTREEIEALARYVRSFDKKLKADKSGKGGR
jgi:mono/diheme cytochrome c family protein